MTSTKNFPVTPTGYATLLQELEHLKAVERPAVIQAISEARSHGDLSENAEYAAAKELQGLIEAKIADVDDKIARAEVIDPADVKEQGSVQFGATVVLSNLQNGTQKKYRIVGDSESNIKLGDISIFSPLARALLLKKVGNEVEVETPHGEVIYEIVDIEYPQKEGASAGSQ